MSDTCDAPASGSYLEDPADASCQSFAPAAGSDHAPLSAVQMFRFTMNTFNQITMFLLVVAICWKCLQLKLAKTAMHAYLCTIGFVLMFAEGLMVRYSGNPLTYGLEPQTKTTLHVSLQLVGGLLGLIGTGHKMLDKKKHFHTLHGKFGIASCIFCLLNFVCGFGTLYSATFREYITPLASTLLHNILGLITFVLAMIAQYYGYETGFFRRNYTNPKNYKFVTIIVLILTIVGPIQICVGNYIKFKNYAK